MTLGRDEYPPGVPCWVDTWQRDVDAAADFYGALFDWTFDDRMPDAEVRYLVARLRDLDVAAVGSRPPGAPPEATWNTYVAVADVGAAVSRATGAGGELLAGPFDIHDAGRMAILADPSGAVLYLWQGQRRAGAQLVNAPGSWNWSNLETDDPERAKAFYGAAFGWEADAMAFGGGEASMLRLPGYGDFLAARDPDLRRRHAQDGVPARFSDAIGWMTAAGTGDAPAWSVTFAVTDPDAIAARTAQLGGTVLVEPYDVAPVRIAVLRDPQGARFTVSAFDPQAVAPG